MYRITTSLLLAGLAATSLAIKSEDAIVLEKRQTVNLSTGGTSNTGSDAGTTTEITSLPPSTTTFTTSDSVTSGIVVDTSTTIPVTPGSTSTASGSASSAAGSSSTATSTSSESLSTSFSSFVYSSTQEYTTIYTTFTNGQATTATSVGSTVVSHTTSSAVATSRASSSNSNGSGLSPSSKKVIGGVVGGVGGALLLGALGFTAWRIWGKKKTLHDDDLYDPNSHQDKLSSSTDANTPFRSTLDQYHQPGPVNTASNF